MLVPRKDHESLRRLDRSGPHLRRIDTSVLMGELLHAILRLLISMRLRRGREDAGLFPAPVAGWNTQDPEAAMDPSFATQMDNYFPERGRVISRRGSKQFADTTDTGAVETLFNWVSGASNKLFAITGTTLYDVTDPASVGRGNGHRISHRRAAGEPPQ